MHPLKDNADSIMSRVNEGELITEIAKEYGVAPSSIYSLLKRRFGYIPKGRYKKTIKSGIDDNDLSYIAGLFDGEGSLFSTVQKSGNLYWQLSISSTDEDVISWLHSIGGSKESAGATSSGKPNFKWRVGRSEDLKILLPELLKFTKMNRRKTRIKEALKDLS